MPPEPDPTSALSADRLSKLLRAMRSHVENEARFGGEEPMRLHPESVALLLASLPEDRRDRDWQITTLRSALENYGRHHPWCTYVAENVCNCGLADLLRQPPVEGDAGIRHLALAFRKMLTEEQRDTLTGWLNPHAALDEFVAFLRAARPSEETR